jgi:hypothetical protein
MPSSLRRYHPFDNATTFLASSQRFRLVCVGSDASCVWRRLQPHLLPLLLKPTSANFLSDSSDTSKPWDIRHLHLFSSSEADFGRTVTGMVTRLDTDSRSGDGKPESHRPGSSVSELVSFVRLVSVLSSSLIFSCFDASTCSRTNSNRLGRISNSVVERKKTGFTPQFLASRVLATMDARGRKDQRRQKQLINSLSFPFVFLRRQTPSTPSLQNLV